MRIAPLVGISLLTFSLSVGSPLATPAVAEDRPQPPTTDEVARRADLARQQAAALEKQRQQDLARSAATAQGVALQREIARQRDVVREETLAAERARGRADRVSPALTATLGIPLSRCDATSTREQLVVYGASVLLTGDAWYAKTRGLVEDFIRRATVTATVNGAPIADASRYLLPATPVVHPTLGNVWMTRWEYSLAIGEQAAAVELVVTVDHSIVDLTLFDADGRPIRFEGFASDLRCTIRPAVAVTGRVTGAGEAIADAVIDASDTETGHLYELSANASGDFSVLLVPGRYRFEFRSAAGPWMPEWWDDKAAYADATIVTLAFGATPPRLLADLARGVFVSGHVTDAETHAAIAGLTVYAQESSGSCCYGSSTGTDGGYRFVVRPGSSLVITFDPPRGVVPYLTQYWNGKRSFGEADRLAVGSTDITGIDAAMERGVFVRGRVTVAASAEPLARVSVQASSVQCCETFMASTAADGTYALPVRRSTSIVVGFFPPTNVRPYMPTYWSGKRSFGAADPLAVGTADVPAIDAAIEVGVYLRGRVTDAATGNGVGGTAVIASVGGCCGDSSLAFSGGDGSYVVAVRTNVTLRVSFQPAGNATPYLPQYYRHRATFAEADQIPVGTADIGGIDAALERGIVLSGRVTAAATGAPIAEVSVTATRVDIMCCDSTFAMTDGDGRYAAVLRPNTRVTVTFSPPRGTPYLTQWYRQHSTPNPDVISVGYGDIGGIDAALDRGVFVRGHVSDAETHAPIGGVGVAMLLVATSSGSSAYTTTDSAGDYVLVASSGATVKIGFTPPSAGSQPYVPQWYHGKPTFDAADALIASSDLTGIDAALERGAFVTGRVTDAPSGAPMRGVLANAGRSDGSCCDWWYGWTDDDGRYTLSVPRNVTLKVAFDPLSNGPGAHVPEWWNDRYSFATADPIAVGTANVTGIDAALSPGVVISGRVTDAVTHDGIGGAYVDASVLDVPCCEDYSRPADANGEYRIVVRRDVHVKVGFFPPYGSDYRAQYWNAKADFASADVLAVAATDLLGIDAALTHGLRISGRVSKVGGDPIPNVSVNIENADACCGSIGGAGTAFDGTYSVTVSPGRYKVHFLPPTGSAFLAEYYNDKPDWSSATTVVVGTTSVTGIDAMLAEGLRISGQVYDELAHPVAGASVNAYAPTTCCSWVAGTSTASDGTYSLSVPPGTYKVEFYGPYGSDLLHEFYDDATDWFGARELTVGTSSLTGIDAVLARGVLVSGHIRGPDGTPLAYASANAYRASACCDFVAGTTTSTDGSYVFALPAGKYVIEFDPPYQSDLRREYYDNKQTFGTADVVTAAVGTPLTIDATLDRGAAVSGRVADTAGAGIADVTVLIELLTCCDAVEWTTTLPDGTYALNVVPGTYKIGFFPPSGSTLFGEFYDDKRSFDTADPVLVGSGGLTGINAVLSGP